MMGLQAFEASARHQSFTEAAKELCLTQGAISRQIRLLEQAFGIELFHRVHNRLVLTHAGEDFLRGVRNGLDSIDAAASRLVASKEARGVLNLASLPTFSTRWLMPRFRSFAEASPDIVVNIFSRTYTVDFTNESFDAAIHIGTAACDGARGDRLMDEDAIPVCSPALLEADARLCHPDGFGRFKLLQQTQRPGVWADWSQAAGLNHPDCFAGPRFEQAMVMIEAARAGLGLALVPRFMVQDELSAQQLVVPFEVEVRTNWAYWFVYPEHKLASPALWAFRAWLLGQVQPGLAATA